MKGKIGNSIQRLAFVGTQKICSHLDDVGEVASPLDNGESFLTTKEWLTCEEAAKYLRISMGRLRNMTSDMRVRCHKLGRSCRYLKTDLNAALIPKT